ncbi:MAG: hypothetical protein WEA61_09340 [Anaerolineales bacterium]
MNKSPFETLQFDRRLRVRLSPRAIWLLGTSGVYLLAWWLLPTSTLFWLGLPVILALAWCASFAWREALHILDNALHRIERL